MRTRQQRSIYVKKEMPPRRYGAAALMTTSPQVEFLLSNETRAGDAALSQELSLHDQGQEPVCTAMVALALYENFLIRHGRPAPRPQAWMWIYYSSLTSEAQDVITTQLLTGVPLLSALKALQERGLARPFGKEEDLAAYAAHLQQLDGQGLSPLTTPAVAFRIVRVLPQLPSFFELLSRGVAIGFTFGVDARIDEWMHDATAQLESNYECPVPGSWTDRLATHAAVIVALELTHVRVKVQNSFGKDFGEEGYFYIRLSLLWEPAFTNQEFFAFLR